MSRKTHSDEEGTSFIRELRKEFSGTLNKGEDSAIFLMNRYPKQIFIGMVILIVLSSILAFVYRPFEGRQKPDFMRESVNEISGTVTNEINTILDLGDRVKRISLLKLEVERIILQDNISEEDSMFLEMAILELEYFNNQNKKSNEDRF